MNWWLTRADRLAENFPCPWPISGVAIDLKMNSLSLFITFRMFSNVTDNICSSLFCPPCQTGPTAWIIFWHCNLPASLTNPSEIPNDPLSFTRSSHLSCMISPPIENINSYYVSYNSLRNMLQITYNIFNFSQQIIQ